MSTKMQDAVRDYLQGTPYPMSAIRPTQTNTRNVIEAGRQIVEGMALLISTDFQSSVEYESTPIEPSDLSLAAISPWRVTFGWQAAKKSEHEQPFDELNDEDDDEDDDDDEDEQP